MSRHERGFCELRILSSPGDSSSLFRGVASYGSLLGYPAHEIFVPDECSSYAALGTQLIMFIHLGARKIHAVLWQTVSRDLPELCSITSKIIVAASGMRLALLERIASYLT